MLHPFAILKQNVFMVHLKNTCFVTVYVFFNCNELRIVKQHAYTPTPGKQQLDCPKEGCETFVNIFRSQNQGPSWVGN